MADDETTSTDDFTRAADMPGTPVQKGSAEESKGDEDTPIVTKIFSHRARDVPEPSTESAHDDE